MKVEPLHPIFAAELIGADLSEQVSDDELRGFAASTGYEEGGMCMMRKYEDHRLTRSGDTITLETETKTLADKPAEDGFCSVQPSEAQQEVALQVELVREAGAGIDHAQCAAELCARADHRHARARRERQVHGDREVERKLRPRPRRRTVVGRRDEQQEPGVLGQLGGDGAEERPGDEAGAAVQQQCEQALPCARGIRAEQAQQATCRGGDATRPSPSTGRPRPVAGSISTSSPSTTSARRWRACARSGSRRRR